MFTPWKRNGMTRPEIIRAYVEREYAPKWVDRVFDGLMDVATGTRQGNACECRELAMLFPHDPPLTPRRSR